MSDIKIIALGGVRENAKNLYIVEINDSIFILDAGLKYPENEQLGVDFVIPNLDYLIENRDRIQGIFLTHGHADAIGALPYILQEVKAPVFGSSLTIELAKLLSRMLALRNSITSMLLTQKLKLNLRMLRFHSSKQLTLFQNQWGLFLALTRAILSIQVTSSLTKLPVLTTKLI